MPLEGSVDSFCGKAGVWAVQRLGGLSLFKEP